MKREQGLSIKTLTRRSVWDISENDVFLLWKEAERDADLKDNKRHYLDLISSAFEMEELVYPKNTAVKKYEARGFKIGYLKGVGSGDDVRWAVKKREIMRVGELTYDNIHHLSAKELLELIRRNFGGGWDSLTENTRNVICSWFDISTTTLPKDRLHNPGGIYDKKVAEEYEVLEIPKGTWTEVIFAKEKPEIVVTDDDGDDDIPTPNFEEFGGGDGEDDGEDGFEDGRGEDGFEEEEEYPAELKEEDVISEDGFEEEGFDEGEGEGEITIDDVVAGESAD